MITSQKPSVKLELTSQASFNINQKNQGGASPANSRMQQHSVKFEGESQASSKFPTTQQQPVFGKTFSFRPYFEIKAASSATQS